MKISHCAATVKVRMPTNYLLPSRRTMIATAETITTNSSLEWITRSLDSTVKSHSDTPTYDHFRVNDGEELPPFLREFSITNPGFIQRFGEYSSLEFDTSIAYTFIHAGFIEIDGVPHFVLINATKGNGFNTFSFQYQSMESVIREIPVNCGIFNALLYEYFSDCNCIPNNFGEVGTNDQDTRAKLSADRILDDIVYSKLGLTKFDKNLNLQISQGDNPEAIKIDGERIEWIAGRLRIIDPRGIPVVSLMSGEAAVRQFEELEASIEQALKNGEAVKITSGYIFNDNASDAISTTGAAYSKASTRRRNTEAESAGKSNAKLMLESSLVYIPRPDGTLELYIIPAKITDVRDINESPEIISLEDAGELITPRVDEPYLTPVGMPLLEPQLLTGDLIANDFMASILQNAAPELKMPDTKQILASLQNTPHNRKPSPNISPTLYIADIRVRTEVREDISATARQAETIGEPMSTKADKVATVYSAQNNTSPATVHLTQSGSNITVVGKKTDVIETTQDYSQNVSVVSGNIPHVRADQVITTHTRSVSLSRSQSHENKQSSMNTHSAIDTQHHMTSIQADQIPNRPHISESIGGRSTIFTGLTSQHQAPHIKRPAISVPAAIHTHSRIKAKATLTLNAAANLEEDTQTLPIQNVNPFLRLLEIYGS